MLLKEDGSIHLSWNNLHCGVIDTINGERFGPAPLKHLQIDAVVGVSRGGLVPAVLFSQHLDVPLLTVDYSARKEQDVYTQIPPIDNKYKHVLIVDDIADRGYTLRHICDLFTSRGHHVNDFALIYKPESIHKPTFYAYKLEPNSGWVHFPYESSVDPNVALNISCS